MTLKGAYLRSLLDCSEVPYKDSCCRAREMQLS